MPPRLLLFDLDDTLWPCKPTIARAERILYDWLCERLPGLRERHDIDSLREQRKRLMQAHPEWVHDLTRVRRESLLALCREHRADPRIAEHGSALFCRERNQVTPYPEVIPVLRALRKEFTLASLTNGNADVRQTPLGELFDHAIRSIEVGHAKPHPAMFLAACERAGAAPEETLMIGDDPERDIEPARALGMKTMLILRDRPLPDDSRADLVAPDLRPLTTWLARA